MNPIVKRIGQVIFGFALLFAAALAFQNCGGYQAYNASTANLSSSCSNSSSCGDAVQNLSLQMTTSALEILIPDLAPNNIIDVGGYCNSSGLTNTEIRYQWTSGSTVLPGFDWTSTGARCNDLGRFQIAAKAPQISSPVTYYLHVRLDVALGNGQYQQGPSVAEHQITVKFQ